MRVTIDDGSCHGHQACAIAAPEVFGADDYGNGIVLLDGGEVPERLRSTVRRAAGNCPERAILILD